MFYITFTTLCVIENILNLSRTSYHEERLCGLGITDTEIT